MTSRRSPLGGPLWFDPAAVLDTFDRDAVTKTVDPDRAWWSSTSPEGPGGVRTGPGGFGPVGEVFQGGMGASTPTQDPDPPEPLDTNDPDYWLKYPQWVFEMKQRHPGAGDVAVRRAGEKAAFDEQQRDQNQALLDRAERAGTALDTLAGQSGSAVGGTNPDTKAALDSLFGEAGVTGGHQGEAGDGGGTRGQGGGSTEGGSNGGGDDEASKHTRDQVSELNGGSSSDKENQDALDKIAASGSESGLRDDAGAGIDESNRWNEALVSSLASLLASGGGGHPGEFHRVGLLSSLSSWLGDTASAPRGPGGGHGPSDSPMDEGGGPSVDGETIGSIGTFGPVVDPSGEQGSSTGSPVFVPRKHLPDYHGLLEKDFREQIRVGVGPSSPDAPWDHMAGVAKIGSTGI